MRSRFLAPALMGALTVLLAAAAPLAADLRPAGPEVPLTFLTDGATCPTTAALPDGSFLVVWSPAQFRGRALCNPEGRVVAQVLDRDGQPAGPRFVVGRSGGRCIDDLQIGFPADGGIPISWTEQQGELGPPRQIVRRLATEGRFSSRPLLDQPGYALVHLRSGDMAVLNTPASDGAGGRALPVQRFSAAGRPGAPRRIPLGFLEEFRKDRFAAAEVGPGTLVVIWGNPSGLLSGRRFQLDGTLLGPPFTVADSEPLFPRVAGNGRGRFVVTWFKPDEGEGEARAQVFGLRRALTGPFPVNVRPAGTQIVSSVEMTADGRLALSWLSARQPREDFNAVARLFAPDGQGLDRAVELASDPAGRQVCSRLVGGIDADSAADGRWLATWQGPGPDGEELFARLLVDE